MILEKKLRGTRLDPQTEIIQYQGKRPTITRRQERDEAAVIIDIRYEF